MFAAVESPDAKMLGNEKMLPNLTEAGYKNSLNGHGKVQSVAHTHCVNCIPIYQAYFVPHEKREVFEFRC